MKAFYQQFLVCCLLLTLIQEAIDTGADEVAVACPFCYIMMDDGVKELGEGDNVKVRDVSLILLDNLKKD